jgi:hypothetical protein
MKKSSPTKAWQKHVQQQLPLLGHRNWIAIVDSAYPWQSASGIETVATASSQLEVVKFVLNAVGKATHIRPLIYIDAELARLPEQDAPGIGAYRKNLDQLLSGKEPQAIPHDQIIAMLDKAGAAFRTLVLKSTLTLPYTSVFIQLDCGYWSAEAEQRLRRSARG